jgi:Methyltransferase small domain
MAVALLPNAPVRVHEQDRTCCADRSDDARALAAVVASAAPSGPLLDVGCGSGSISLAVLQARPDVGVVRIDVSTSRCREAERRAVASGLSHRFRAIARSASEVDLPRLSAVVANPPMLPTEPGLAFPTARGGRDRFWMRLLRRRVGMGSARRAVAPLVRLPGRRRSLQRVPDHQRDRRTEEVQRRDRASRLACHRPVELGAEGSARPSPCVSRRPHPRRPTRASILEVDATEPLSIAHSIVHLARTQHHEPPSENKTQEHAR